MSTEDKMIALYDALVKDKTASGDGLPIAIARQQLYPAVRALVVASKRNVEAEVEQLLKSQLMSTRRKRSRNLLPSLVDVMAIPEDADYVDPMLDMAFPLGSADGTDKTLRYWTETDVLNAAVERTEIATQSHEAALEFKSTADRAVKALRRSKASTLGEWCESQRPSAN